MNQIMGMMSGENSVAHTLELTLASRTKPAAAPQADHLIPPGLTMGPSLPLVAPDAPKPVKESYGLPQGYEKPKGRMLIYWGCGEHVAAGQPTVLDFAKMAAGQVPPGMAALANIARSASPPNSAAGFGQWPNKKDSRAGSGERLAARRAQGPGQLRAADRLHAGAGLHARARPDGSGRDSRRARLGCAGLRRRARPVTR